MLWLISEWKILGLGRPDPWMGEEEKKERYEIENNKNENNVYFYLTNKPKTNI